jgi:hypothetical protein
VPTAWLVKLRVVAESVTAGAVPVPLKVTICGLVEALSVSVRLPERLPVAVGVKVTLITQLLLAATDALVLQVVPLAATAKSPVIAMLVKDKDALPVLVTVTDVAALVVPMAWLAKVRLVADSETAGALGGALVVEPPPPPPQFARTINPTNPANRQQRFATEKVLGLIAPPPT